MAGLKKIVCFFLHSLDRQVNLFRSSYKPFTGHLPALSEQSKIIGFGTLIERRAGFIEMRLKIVSPAKLFAALLNNHHGVAIRKKSIFFLNSLRIGLL